MCFNKNLGRREKNNKSRQEIYKCIEPLNIIQTSGVSDPQGIKCLLPDKHPRDVECRRGSLANLQIKQIQGIPRPSQVSRMIVKITKDGIFFHPKTCSVLIPLIYNNQLCSNWNTSGILYGIWMLYPIE